MTTNQETVLLTLAVTGAVGAVFVAAVYLLRSLALGRVLVVTGAFVGGLSAGLISVLGVRGHGGGAGPASYGAGMGHFLESLIVVVGPLSVLSAIVAAVVATRLSREARWRLPLAAGAAALGALSLTVIVAVVG